MKKIGYVCTTGKSLSSEERIKELHENGLTVVRFNMSYRDKCMIDDMIPLIEKINKEENYKIETMVDLCGPEIRIDTKEPLEVEKGDILSIGDEITLKSGDISILEIGDIITFGDGEISAEVIAKNNGILKCMSLNNGKIKANKKITNEKLYHTIDFISEKDIEDIKTALDLNADYLCVSFVNNLDNINEIKKIVGNHPIKIIAKIETVEGVENLKSIVQVVDGVMIGRGDLGVRYPIYDVARIQKIISKIVKENNKKLIIATGFLSSMKTEEIPTRAEVSDFYNALLDGADEIMFSGETAAANDPNLVLDCANKIVESYNKIK